MKADYLEPLPRWFGEFEEKTPELSALSGLKKKLISGCQSYFLINVNIDPNNQFIGFTQLYSLQMPQFGERVAGDVTQALDGTFFYHKMGQFVGGIKGPGFNVALYPTRIGDDNIFYIEQSKSRSIKVRLPLGNEDILKHFTSKMTNISTE